MPKITLNLVLKGSHFCSGRLSVGVYVKNKMATLIDSGIDEGTAKDIDKALKAQDYRVKAIINTHSHADHCGGNSYFQKQYKDIKIYSTKYEKHYIEEPINEPRCFCRGTEPFSELRNKFLEAMPSTVTNVIEPYADQSIEISEEKFQVIALPGHSPGMIAVISPDNVLYTGDAIFGNETLDKHGVLFYTDIANTLASFQKLKSLKLDGVVFYHGGEMKEDMQDVVQKHEKKILQTKDAVFELISKEPQSLDSLTQQVMKRFNIPENVTQFTLTSTCVNAYVRQLESENKIKILMKDGLMIVMSCVATISDEKSSSIAQAQKNTDTQDIRHASLLGGGPEKAEEYYVYHC